jgi:tetratricopeptide (TPR) repeat protein
MCARLVSRKMHSAVGAIGLTLVAASLVSGAAPVGAKPPIGWKVHTGDGWAAAAPADWIVFGQIPPPTELYLIGDGRTGVPMLDGTLSPLKMGVTIEVAPSAGRSAKEEAERSLAALKAEKRFRPRGRPTVRELRLADGRKARVVAVVMDRLDNGRLSFYYKLFVTTPDNNTVTATGFLTSGPNAQTFVQEAGVDAFLAAHVLSLVLDPEKLDKKALSRAYSGYNWRLPTALSETLAGNNSVEHGRYAQAAEHYRTALKICDSVSAAHNGLAWALLQSRDPNFRDPARALAHAKTAARLTARKDPAVLDTLALAYHVSGKRKEALAALREALKLAPDNPELKKTLKEIEGDG